MLPKTLNSLKTGTLSDYEVIVVNNGASVEVAKAMDTAAVLVSTYPPTTLAAAANVGIRRAKGRYIVRVDADDWVEPELLQLEAEFLDARPDISCVWCDTVEAVKVSEGSTRHDAEVVCNGGSDWSTYLLTPRHQPKLELACGAMFRKQAWERLGGYREDLERQENYDFWLRFHQKFESKRLEIPLYYYRQHAGSMHTDEEKVRAARAKVRADFLKQFGRQP